MSNFSKYKIEQVRLIHNAFKKDDRDHVASYIPESPYAEPTVVMEKLYNLTQNIEESWIKNAQVQLACNYESDGKFTMCPNVDTRSTCVGDVMEICYPSESGNGYRTVTYVVADVGFERV